jgi:hypothetical protein
VGRNDRQRRATRRASRYRSDSIPPGPDSLREIRLRFTDAAITLADAIRVMAVRQNQRSSHMIKLGKVSAETRDSKFLSDPETDGLPQIFF